MKRRSTYQRRYSDRYLAIRGFVRLGVLAVGAGLLFATFWLLYMLAWAVTQ